MRLADKGGDPRASLTPTRSSPSVGALPLPLPPPPPPSLPLLFLPFSPSSNLPCFSQMAARPATSRSGRSTTTPGPLDPSTDSNIDRDPQYTYSQEYSLEDQDDESDDEDVFAFLPPSTAQPSQSPSLPSPVQSPPLPQLPPPQASFPQQHFPASVPYPASPPPPFFPVADPLIYPPPAFDPHALERHIPQAGPSTTSVHFVGTVDSPSPPSTADRRDSQSSTEDGFRLRKLGRLPTGVSATTGFTTSSSQLPLDDKRRSFLFQEKRQTSTALSDLSTADPELDGADSVSIKSVCPLPFLPHIDSPVG